MDLVEPRERVLPKVDEYNRDNIFNEIFFVSALKGSGLDELKVRNFYFIESPSPIVRRAHSHTMWVFAPIRTTSSRRLLPATCLTRLTGYA
jgi:hypothetical protein